MMHVTIPFAFQCFWGKHEELNDNDCRLNNNAREMYDGIFIEIPES